MLDAGAHLVRRGTPAPISWPGSGGSQRLARLIGLSRAKYHVMTGTRISAAQAEEVLDRGADGPLYTGIELERKAYAMRRSPRPSTLLGPPDPRAVPALAPLKPLPEERVLEIVDELFMPLVQAASAQHDRLVNPASGIASITWTYLPGSLCQRRSPKEMAKMTDNDPAVSTPPEEEPALSRQQEPGTSQPAEDPGYLTVTGEAVGEDGSVAPIIGGLPAVEGSAWDIGAPLDDRGAGLADEQGSPPEEDTGSS